MLSDHRREVLGAGVARLQMGARRHDTRYLAGVTVVGLVLVGDCDPIPAFDKRRDIRRQVIDRDPRHRIRRTMR